MKKLLPCLTAVLLLGVLPLCAAAAAPEVSAASAIVLEPETDTVLYEKDADTPRLIASTTKIMTALVVLEHCALDEPVTVTAAHAAVEGSSMYLQPGERYTVEQLLYGLLLVSGNDAAAALADHCAGSMEGFAALMNEKAAALGLTHTHFANAHGLDADGHYSTARDLAYITAAAMWNPDFCTIFAAQSYTRGEQTYVNHNRLLRECEGCIGGKTGYTEAAGRALVSCVEREGMRLICVTLSDPDDWADHAALYDAAFSGYRILRLPEYGWQQLGIISGTTGVARLECVRKAVVVPKAADVRLAVYLPRFVFAPVYSGGRAGTLDVLVDGEPVLSTEILYGETVPADRSIMLTAWERFRRFWFPLVAQG